MTKNEAKNRIEKLREVINHHRFLYHVSDQPEIADSAYDELEQELIRLETQFPDLVTLDSPTQRVSGQPLDKFTKVVHQVPQWSFNDAFSPAEMRDFDKRVKKTLDGFKQDPRFREDDTVPTYVCELKIDGFKIVLTYEHGVLKNAATRGDGKIGEDVTMNVRTIESIPLKLKEPVDVIVEGEIWMGKNEFEKINKERELAGEALFANPRNMAAGTIRQLDPRVVAKRKLSNYIYDLSRANFPLPKTQGEELKRLAELGFNVNKNYQVCSDIEEVIKYWEKWQKQKVKENYWVDGVVVKVDERKYQEEMGYTGKAPRFGIAFKFPAEQVTTVLEDIVLQVGRVGTITPIAHLRPVLVAGSTVSRATLHNEDEIARLDVRIGDTVIIQKAGDVIPDIVSVIKELRTGKEKIFHFPKEIPNVGPIERLPGQVAYRAVNKNSFAQLKRKFYHFVGKDAFDIVHLGPKVVDALLEGELIANFPDIFTLKKGDLLALPRFGEKSVDNLLAAIEGRKQIELSRFITALSITHVGTETAEDVANHFKTIEKIAGASEEEFNRVPGIGSVVSQSLYLWFRDKESLKLVKELLRLVTIKPVEAIKARNEKVYGQVFVLTGTMAGLDREEAKKIIKSLGGDVSSSVSKNTDYVVAGENPGSKYDKAIELGVRILTEAEFLKLVK